jgi:hypothetical protein
MAARVWSISDSPNGCLWGNEGGNKGNSVDGLTDFLKYLTGYPPSRPSQKIRIAIDAYLVLHFPSINSIQKNLSEVKTLPNVI